MTGAPDPEYVAARRTLLDALEALGPQRQATTLIGAQAIYLHTGEDESLSVAPFTSDADLSLDPELLLSEPLIERAMTAAGFVPSPDHSKVGTWIGPNGVPIDLMVPEARAGRGRRSANIPPHAPGTARRVHGLEASLVDRRRHSIASLESTDSRSYEIWIAGPGALLVAKLLKIRDRLNSPSRLENKDALDVLRMLRAIPTTTFAGTLRQLRTQDLSRAVTDDALQLLKDLFGVPTGRGAQMAATATLGLNDPAEISASCVALTQDLLTALDHG